MLKKVVPSKTRKPRKTASKNAEQKIAVTLGAIDQLTPPTPQVAATLALFKSWLQDESGYDEETWPRLKQALENERRRVRAPEAVRWLTWFC